MSVKNLLDNEIRNELENLGKEAIGSDNYKANLDGVTKLLDRQIEIEKLENERINKEMDREVDFHVKNIQIKEEKKDRRIKNGITIGTFVGSAALYMVAFIASTNFEREGTFTTEGGRGALRNLLRIKK